LLKIIFQMIEKLIRWNSEKNEWLKRNRNLCFEDVLIAFEQQKLLVKMEHPNKTKYPNQQIFIIDINNYAYLVPYVESESEIFLKTIIPSRVMTKKYLKNSYHEEE